MLDKYIRYLIVFSCLFGLTGILFISFIYDTRTVSVSNLVSKAPDDRIYIVNGKLKNSTTKSNVLFFEICDYSSCLSSVYFNPTKEEQSFFTKTSEITLKVKYTTYNNQPELIVFSFWS